MQSHHLLARAKVQHGDYAFARQNFDDALKLSQRIGDDTSACLAHQDIALLLLRQGKYPEALSHTDDTFNIANKLGAKKLAASSRVDRANGLWRLGRYDEARAALTEAAGMAEKPGAARDLASYYHLALARMALSERRLPKAREEAQQAITMSGNQVLTAAILGRSTLGSAEALSGSGREGAAKCQEALELARQSSDPYLISEALLLLAETQAQHGNWEAALKAALESQAPAERIGKLDSEWLAYSIAAQAARGLNRPQEARDYSTRAANALSRLEQQWGKDNYNSYLARTDVQISRKQISELVAVKP
jgi:tetratricopeptide (TPR) repeat protein